MPQTHDEVDLQGVADEAEVEASGFSAPGSGSVQFLLRPSVSPNLVCDPVEVAQISVLHVVLSGGQVAGLAAVQVGPSSGTKGGSLICVI